MLPLLLIDAKLRVVAANRAFYQAFRGRPSGTEKRSLFDAGGGQWEIPMLRDRFQKVLSQKQILTDFEVRLPLPKGGNERSLLNARPISLRGAGGRMALVALVAIEGITRIREAMEKSEERFRLLAEIGATLSRYMTSGRRSN